MTPATTRAGLPEHERVPKALALDLAAAAALLDIIYVFRMDPDPGFEYVSPSVTQLVGYTPQEHYDDPGLGARLVDPRDAEVLAGAAEAPIGEVVELVVRWIRRDGTLIWTRHRCSKQLRRDGSLVLYGAARDITAEHQAAEDLRAAEERSRMVLENTDDAILRFAPDRVLEWASPSIATVLGHEPAAVVGTRLVFVAPVDLDRVRAQFAAAEADHQERVEYRARATRADGTLIWVDVRSRLVWDQAGNLAAFVVAVRDVTAQVAVDERYRLLVEHAVDVVVQAVDGVIEWISPSIQALSGWDPHELEGAAAPDIWHPDDAQLAASLWSPTDSRPQRVRLRMRRRDGGYLWVEAGLRAYVAEDGRHGAVGWLRDISERVAAEMAREAAESLLMSAMAESPIGIGLVSPEGRLVRANAALCGFLGRSESQLASATWSDLVLDADLEGENALLREILSGMRSSYRRVRAFRGPDGSQVWGDLSVSVDRDPGGQVRFLVAQVVDITDTMAARALLHQSEEHYRLLAENTSDVVLLVSLDGLVEWASPSAQVTLGWSPEELVGLRNVDLVHPDDLSMFRQEVARLAATGRPALLTFRMRRPDGSHRWVEATSQTVPAAPGRPAVRVVRMRDVHEQVQVFQDLARSEEMFRTAMDSAPVGMAVLSLGRRFLRVNQALQEILGRDADWLLGHGIGDVVHPDDEAMDLEMRRMLISGERASLLAEKRVRSADGKVHWVQHAIGLIRDQTGQPVSFVSQFLDITEARETRQALEYLADHDPLTSLRNRRAILNSMSAVLSHEPRAGTQLAVLYLDVDGLKPVNDRLGHSAGDALLTEVARRIRACVRSQDLVGRLGGDEFVVLLAQVRGLTDAAATARLVADAVAQPIRLADREVRVTISIGLTLAAPGEKPDEVLGRADQALYRAKERGGNRLEVDPPDLPQEP